MSPGDRLNGKLEPAQGDIYFPQPLTNAQLMVYSLTREQLITIQLESKAKLSPYRSQQFDVLAAEAKDR